MSVVCSVECVYPQATANRDIKANVNCAHKLQLYNYVLHFNAEVSHMFLI